MKGTINLPVRHPGTLALTHLSSLDLRKAQVK